MPRNGAIRSFQCGSTLFCRCCSGAWKRRASANLLSLRARRRLRALPRKFLAELALTLRDRDRLYVHSDASHPARWRYVQSAADAAHSIEATDARVTCCGHIHLPGLYSMSAAAKMTSFVPATG